MKDANNKLIPNNSYMYDDNGMRLVYRGADTYVPETDEEFMSRFTAGNVDIADLKRCCMLHPLIQQYAAEGKDYSMVIEGTIKGVGYRQLMKNAGFHSWATFRSMTEWQCEGLKSLFRQAMTLRDDYRLEAAEEALRERAIEGVQEEVYTHGGKFCGTKTKYSDKLLEIHLKALAPEKYAERHRHEVKGLVLSVNMGLRDPE